MGAKDLKPQPRQIFACPAIGEDMVPEAIGFAVAALGAWGVAPPAVGHAFDDGPNRHMCLLVDA